MPAGSYQLIAKYGNNQSVSVGFTISSVAQTVAINLGSDPNGFVDAIDLVTGIDITQLGTAIVGHAIQITAYPYNSNAYQFAGWTDNYGILGPVNKMYPQVSITATSSGINIYANFSAISSGGGGGGSGGGTLVPGNPGDWYYYLTWPDGSKGWFSAQWVSDEVGYGDNNWYSAQGPYASGTTVNI